MDRAYVDFQRLFVFTLCSSFFVVRSKKNVVPQRRYSHAVDQSRGVRSDQTVILGAIESAPAYPDPLRRVSYCEAATNKRLKFLTNNFALPALTIARIYKSPWQIELFFKWLKQQQRRLGREARPAQQSQPFSMFLSRASPSMNAIDMKVLPSISSIS